AEGEGGDAVELLQDRVVDRVGGEAAVELAQAVRSNGDRLQPPRELRLVEGHEGEQRRAPEEEDAGVPEVVAGLQEAPGVLLGGLLDEAVHPPRVLGVWIG